jgi:hypothetical protein
MKLTKSEKQEIADKIRSWNYQKVSARCLMDTFGLSHYQAISVMRFMV